MQVLPPSAKPKGPRTIALLGITLGAAGLAFLLQPFAAPERLPAGESYWPHVRIDLAIASLLILVGVSLAFGAWLARQRRPGQPRRWRGRSRQEPEKAISTKP